MKNKRVNIKLEKVTRCAIIKIDSEKLLKHKGGKK